VTVLIEMIMDRGVDGGKLLRSLDVPELRHCTLPSSKRVMRAFGSVIEPTPTPLSFIDADHLYGGAVGAKPIRNNCLRLAIALHCALEKLQRSLAVATLS